MLFEAILSKMNLMTNNHSQQTPKNLLIAGILASICCFIMLMVLAGFEIFNQQYATRLFDLIEFSKVLGLMSLVIMPISFMAGMFLVFFTKLVSYLLKIETEGTKWFIGLIIGIILGLSVFFASDKLWMVFIFGATGVWGASFVSMLNLAIVPKDKLAEKTINKN